MKLLGSLEYSELNRLKRDLDSGALLMQHIVNSKINEVETSNRAFCAGCSSTISKGKDEIYTLVFGETTIKKKASFCGMDCLNNFIDVLRQDKEESMRREMGFEFNKEI